MSSECQQLNRLFSLGVDGNIVRVPSALQDPPEPAADAPTFILDILHSAAKETIEATSRQNIQILDSPVDAIDLLLSKDSIAVPEFDLVQLTLCWCRRNDQNFLDYACFFNFGALTDKQQRWILGELPPPQSGPGIVKNGLLQSSLVLSEELHRFGLDHHGLHWKCVFDSSSDRMGRFMDSACRTLELFHKKILFFRPDERLVIAIYIPNKISKASEAHVGSAVRVFALPQSQGADSAQYRVKPTTEHYRLYCDESSFQLYDKKRGNTFVFLTRSQIDKSSLSRSKNEGDRRRQKQVTIDESMNFDCRASIALDKISKDVQTHVGRIKRAGILAAVSIELHVSQGPGLVSSL
jgi:regulator of nonsense transcripts 1